MKVIKSKSQIIVTSIITIMLISSIIMFNYTKKITSKEISYSEFINLLNQNQIERVVIENDTLKITPKKNNTQYDGKILYTANINDGNLVQRLEESKVNYDAITNKPNPIIGVIIIFAVILLFIHLILSNKYLKQENTKLIIKINDLEDKNSIKSDL